MIEVVRVEDSDRAVWDSYVDGMEAAETYHCYEWRNVFRKVYGHRTFYLAAKDQDGEICGILPLAQLNSRLFGNFLVSLPTFNYAGILSESGDAERELVAAARRTIEETGAAYVEMRNRAGIDAGLPVRSDKVSMQLDLPTTPDELWKQFKPKLRAQIRRSTKEGATCETGGEELLDDFYAVFSRNMRDLGTPVFPKSLFREMCRSFPETTRIVVARVAGVPCAGGITHGFRNRIEIPSASSLRKYNPISVNMLMYWTALKLAIESGYSVFDFGRSTVDSGTYRFKRQWGATPQPLHWHYCLANGTDIPQLNPQNPKLKLAVSLWRQLPLPLANLLGPRIVKNLP